MYPTYFSTHATFEAVKNPSGIKAFGVQLRQLREARNLSQQRLADQADVAKITIQRIENAKYTPTLDVLISIAKALKVPMRELCDFHIPREKD